MNDTQLDYKTFLNILNLPDDKISLLLYDLYQYKLDEEDECPVNEEGK